MNRKGEKAGNPRNARNPRSLPRKVAKNLEGLRSVRSPARRSPAQGNGKNAASDSWNDWRDQSESISPKICEYFQSGYCHWGQSCYFSHDWNGHIVDAGVVFLLDADAAEVLVTPWHSSHDPGEGTGPMRVRIVGDTEELGFSEGQWDPNLGIDLCWEGDGWRSMVIPMEADRIFHFCVVRVDQPESHPGLLQGWRRWEMHEARHFTWSQKHQLQAPHSNEILEVHLSRSHCTSHWASVPIPQRLLPRSKVTTGPGRPWWQPAGLRCNTFDAAGYVLKYCLYLPDTYRTQEPLSLVLLLHSMHGKLEGDNNLFFESDTPLRLLLDEDGDRCPRALRDRCVLLVPQCPTDRERGDGAGVWLRKGWYEDSDYDHQAEAALMALVEMIRAQYGLTRVSMCGSSMGAYAALELAARRPNVFSAVALIAAHYDLDPIEPLVTRLTEKQVLPLWFIHAENDHVCPFADMEELVRRLRARSRAEVHLTSFEDTWSSQGHCSDCVAFWARPVVPGALALGDDLFEWLIG